MSEDCMCAGSANLSIPSQISSFMIPQVMGVLMRSSVRNKINLSISHCFVSSDTTKDMVFLFVTGSEFIRLKHFSNYSFNDNVIDQLVGSSLQNPYKSNYGTEDLSLCKKFLKHESHQLVDKFAILKQYKTNFDNSDFSSSIFHVKYGNKFEANNYPTFHSEYDSFILCKNMILELFWEILPCGKVYWTLYKNNEGQKAMRVQKKCKLVFQITFRDVYLSVNGVKCIAFCQTFPWTRDFCVRKLKRTACGRISHANTRHNIKARMRGLLEGKRFGMGNESTNFCMKKEPYSSKVCRRVINVLLMLFKGFLHNNEDYDKSYASFVQVVNTLNVVWNQCEQLRACFKNILQRNILVEVEWNRIISYLSSRTMSNAPRLHGILTVVFLTSKLFLIEPSVRKTITRFLKIYSVDFGILENSEEINNNANTTNLVSVSNKIYFKKRKLQPLGGRTHVFHTWSNSLLKKDREKNLIRQKNCSLNVKICLFPRERSLSKINTFLSCSCQHKNLILRNPAVLPAELHYDILMDNVSSFFVSNKQEKDEAQIDNCFKSCCSETKKINILINYPTFEIEKKAITAYDRKKTISYEMYQALLLEKEELQKCLETEKIRREQLYLKNLDSEEKLINEIKRCQQLSAKKTHFLNQLRFVKAELDTKNKQLITLIQRTRLTEKKFDSSHMGYNDAEIHTKGAEKQLNDFKKPVELLNKKLFNATEKTAFCIENSRNLLMKNKKYKKCLKSERLRYGRVCLNNIDTKENLSDERKKCEKLYEDKQRCLNQLFVRERELEKQRTQFTTFIDPFRFFEQEFNRAQMKYDDNVLHQESLKEKSLLSIEQTSARNVGSSPVEQGKMSCLGLYGALLCEQETQEQRLQKQIICHKEIQVQHMKTEENFKTENKRCEQLALVLSKCKNRLSFAEKQLDKHTMRLKSLTHRSRLMEEQLKMAQLRSNDEDAWKGDVKSVLHTLKEAIEVATVNVSILNSEKNILYDSYERLLMVQNKQKQMLEAERIRYEKVWLKLLNAEKNLLDEKLKCDQLAADKIACFNQLSLAKTELHTQRSQFRTIKEQKNLIEQEYNRAQMQCHDKKVRDVMLESKLHTMTEDIKRGNETVCALQKEKTFYSESYQKLLAERDEVEKYFKGENASYKEALFKNKVLEEMLKEEKKMCQKLAAEKVTFLKQLRFTEAQLKNQHVQFCEVTAQRRKIEQDFNRAQMYYNDKEISRQILEEKTFMLEKAIEVATNKISELQKEKALCAKSYEVLYMENRNNVNSLKSKKVAYMKIRLQKLRAKKTLESFKLRCQHLERKVCNYAKEIGDIKRILREKTTKFNDLKKKTVILEAEFKSLQSHCRSKEILNKSLESTLVSLEKAFDVTSKKLFTLQMENVVHFKSRQALLVEKSHQTDLLKREKIRYEELQHENIIVQEQLQNEKRSYDKLSFEKDECLNQLCVAEEKLRKRYAESANLVQQRNIIERELNIAQMRYHDKDCRNDILEIELHTLKESLELTNKEMSLLQKNSALSVKLHQTLLSENVKQKKLLKCEKIRYKKLQQKYKNMEKKWRSTRKNYKHLASEKTDCLNELYTTKEELSKYLAESNDITQRTSLIEREFNRAQMRYHDKDCRNDILEIELHTLNEALESAKEKISVLHKKNTLSFISNQALLMEKEKHQKVSECEKNRYLKLQHICKNTEKKLRNTKKISKQLASEKTDCLNELYTTKEELSKYLAESNDLTQRTSLIERELNRAQMRYHDKDCRNDILEIELHTLNEALESAKEKISVLHKKNTLSFISNQALLMEKEKHQKVSECEKNRYLKLQHICKNTEKKLRNTKKISKQLASEKTDCLNELYTTKEELSKYLAEFNDLTQRTSLIERELNRAQMRYHDKDCRNDILEIELHTLNEALESANERMRVLQKRNTLSFEAQQALLIDKVKQNKFLYYEETRCRKLHRKINNAENELQNQKKTSTQLTSERDTCLKELRVVQEQLSKERADFNDFIQKTSLVERELNRVQMCYGDNEVHNDMLVKDFLVLKGTIGAANAKIYELKKEKDVALELYQALLAQERNLSESLKSKTALYIKVRLEKLLAKKALENMKKKCQLLERKNCMYKKHIDEIEKELSKQSILLKNTMRHTNFIETELNRVQMEHNDKRSTNKFAEMESNVLKNTTKEIIERAIAVEQNAWVCDKCSRRLVIARDRDRRDVRSENIILEKDIDEGMNMAGHVKDQVVRHGDLHQLKKAEKRQTLQIAMKRNDDNIQKAENSTVHPLRREKNVFLHVHNSCKRHSLETESVSTDLEKVFLDEKKHGQPDRTLSAKIEEILKQQDIDKASIKRLQQMCDDKEDLKNAIKRQCNQFESEILNEREHSAKLKSEIICLNQKNEMLKKNLGIVK
jgi:hypothetical protein